MIYKSSSDESSVCVVALVICEKSQTDQSLLPLQVVMAAMVEGASLLP